MVVELICPCPGAVTDELKQEVATCLSEISKATSMGSRLLGQADMAVQKLSPKECELVMMNLEKLKSTLEEAEEVVWLERMAHNIYQSTSLVISKNNKKHGLHK